MSGERPPGSKRLARGAHRGVHVLGAGLRHPGDWLAVGGIDGLERLPGQRLDPPAADEQAEGAVMMIEPLQHRSGRLGSRAILERFEELGDFAHAMGWRYGAAYRPVR